MVVKVCEICFRWRRRGVWVTTWSWVENRMYDTEFWCQDCIDYAVGLGMNLPMGWHMDVEPKTA